MTARYENFSDRPRFIDQIAVDIVVLEHRYMRLKPTEKRHAAHRLRAQRLTQQQIADIMRITKRSVERLLSKPPPPILDISEDGEYVAISG